MLHLTGPERAYLFALARQVDRHPSATRAGALASPCGTVDPAASSRTAWLARLLDGMAPAPALVVDPYWDVVGYNAAARVFLPEFTADRDGPGLPELNLVRYALTCTAWRTTVPDWAAAARCAVGGLRASLAAVLAAAPDDPRAGALVAGLHRDSPEFRAWWPAHEVWKADHPVRHAYYHPTAGPLEFDVVFLDIRSADGLVLLACLPCNTPGAAEPREGTESRSAVARCRLGG